MDVVTMVYLIFGLAAVVSFWLLLYKLFGLKSAVEYLVAIGILVLLGATCWPDFGIRSRAYRGHVTCQSELSSAPRIVREQLTVIPDGGRDIYYSVQPTSRIYLQAKFTMSEGAFRDWMSSRELVPIENWDVPVLTLERDPNKTESVDEGYYWWGYSKRPLSYDRSYLEVTVVYDSRTKEVYYEHYEIHGDPGS